MAPLKEKIRTFPKKPDLEEMVCRYQESKDPDLMQAIVMRSEKLVYKTIATFRGCGIEYADLSQIGFTGLVRAVNGFDRYHDNKFSTYAVHRIRGEVLHFLRDQSLIRFPRGIFRTGRIISGHISSFEEKNGRSPNRQEIADGTGLELNEIEEFLIAKSSFLYKESFDESLEQKDNKLHSELSRSRYAMDPGPKIEEKIILWNAIAKLSLRHQKILISRLILGKTQEEIGKDIGLSQKSVSKYFHESICMLKKEILQ